MENVRGRINVKLKTQWHGRYGARKLISQTNFKRFNIFNENLVAIEMLKTCVLMNKAISIGLAVLDISKVRMYDFFYNHLKKIYGDKIELMYTDTDSFIFEVETECFYADMNEHLKKYDTSSFAKNNPYGMPQVNEKELGAYKDEMGGELIDEYVGLQSKMYSIRGKMLNKKTNKIEMGEMKRAKGLKTSVLKKTIGFEHYMQCLQRECAITRSQNTIRSKNHNVFSVKQTKIGLSGKDNKRVIDKNNINTLPWGHYSLENSSTSTPPPTKKIRRESSESISNP